MRFVSPWTRKLDTTLKSGLSTSFARVSRLANRYIKVWEEVRALTSGVGDLKIILSGVKTRGGIWGGSAL